MNTKRMERANSYHDRGFNCSQSVLAAFTDVTGLSEEESFRIAAGFGRGALEGAAKAVFGAFRPPPLPGIAGGEV